MIQKATLTQLPEILKLYARARSFMAQTGNPDQWGDVYPPEEMIREDIKNGKSYVNLENGNICAVFYFAVEEDPTYGYIEDGAWLDPSPYGVIHRVASNGTVPGTLRRCLDFCREKIRHLRIDTHADNYPMQHLLDKMGFTRCGIVYMEDGSPRIAYERME